MRLIVGLGNPGAEYERTRHNLGFMLVDLLARETGAQVKRKDCQALVGRATLAGEQVELVKPQTFMNLSGEAVQGLLTFYKIPLSNLLVIADDIDIPLGTIRIREKGGAGGQKGLKSTIERLGTQEFARLRVGVSRPPGRMEAADYVLQNFDKAEEILVIETVDRVVRAVETWLRHGLTIAMTRHNGTADEAARNATAMPPQPKSQPETQPEPQPDSPN